MTHHVCFNRKNPSLTIQQLKPVRTSRGLGAKVLSQESKGWLALPPDKHTTITIPSSLGQGYCDQQGIWSVIIKPSFPSVPSLSIFTLNLSIKKILLASQLSDINTLLLKTYACSSPNLSCSLFTKYNQEVHVILWYLPIIVSHYVLNKVAKPYL